MVKMSCLVCWQHFLISDFKKEISENDIARCNFGQLKKDVVPPQHLPGDPEISLEDTKFALVILENDHNTENIEEKTENSENSHEISEKFMDTSVQPIVIEEIFTPASDIINCLEKSEAIQEISENQSQAKVMRTCIATI